MILNQRHLEHFLLTTSPRRSEGLALAHLVCLSNMTGRIPTYSYQLFKIWIGTGRSQPKSPKKTSFLLKSTLRIEYIRQKDGTFSPKKRVSLANTSISAFRLGPGRSFGKKLQRTPYNVQISLQKWPFSPKSQLGPEYSYEHTATPHTYAYEHLASLKCSYGPSFATKKIQLTK